MARVWEDRIVEKPKTFTVQNNPDGTITLIPAPGQIIQEGTPVNAINLNGIETDILQSQQNIQSITDSFMSHETDYIMQIPYGGTTTNLSNAYSIANPAIDALIEGMAISIKINSTNTGTSTLDWSGTGAISIKKSDSTDVSSGDLVANSIYTLRYNGVNFILQGERGYKVTAGNFTLLQNTNTSYTSSETPVKLRAVKVELGGTYRITFAISSPSTFTAYGQIYINGVAVGIQRSVYNSSLGFTEDIPNLKKNDEIQIYVWRSTGSGSASVYSLTIRTSDLVTTIL